MHLGKSFGMPDNVFTLFNDDLINTKRLCEDDKKKNSDVMIHVVFDAIMKSD